MEENINIDPPGANNPVPESPKPEKNKTSFWQWVKKYPAIFVALIAVIAITAVYYWKDKQGKNQKEAVEKMATQQLMQNNYDMLKLMSKPLIWSIRAEMLRGNLEQVNIFTTDLVKEKNFQFIHLIDPGGNIIVSTDKKMEGQSAIGMFDTQLVQTDSVMIVNNNNEMLTLAAPVMGYDKRLALLVLNYAPVKFNPQLQATADSVKN